MSYEFIEFFMDMVPPTSTGQMRKVRVVKGRPQFYEPEKVRDARDELTRHLARFVPDEPLQGPLVLDVAWYFPAGKSHKPGTWRTTRPDTDNLEKLLKDCMTSLGFWKDDAQVSVERVQKQWSDTPGIMIRVWEIT